jgi:hypothetical protein
MKTEFNIKSKIKNLNPQLVFKNAKTAAVNISKQALPNSLWQGAFYVPGILLILMSVSLFFPPLIFISLLTCFLATLGAISLFVGWRFVQFYSKYKEVVKQIEARVYFKGPVPSWDESISASKDMDKKTVVH